MSWNIHISSCLIYNFSSSLSKVKVNELRCSIGISINLSKILVREVYRCKQSVYQIVPHYQWTIKKYGSFCYFLKLFNFIQMKLEIFIIRSNELHSKSLTIDFNLTTEDYSFEKFTNHSNRHMLRCNIPIYRFIEVIVSIKEWYDIESKVDIPW